MFALAGCSAPAGQTPQDAGNNAAGAPQVTVLASFYPLVWMAQQIAGPEAAVGSLTPPGAEPHDAELTPAQVAQLGHVDLVVTLGGFQPSIDQAILVTEPARVVDAAQVVTLEDSDPHFWLNPLLLAELAPPIADQLSQIDPSGKDVYQQRAAKVAKELEHLDKVFHLGLGKMRGATLTTTHAAFGYLAEHYELEMISISGIDPDSEPSPARLRQVREQIEPLGIKTIFSESTTPDRIAQVLATEVGATVAELNPLEVAPTSGDYLTVMAANLDALKTGLVALEGTVKPTGALQCPISDCNPRK